MCTASIACARHSCRVDPGVRVPLRLFKKDGGVYRVREKFQHLFRCVSHPYRKDRNRMGEMVVVDRKRLAIGGAHGSDAMSVPAMKTSKSACCQKALCMGNGGGGTGVRTWTCPLSARCEGTS